VVRLDTQEGRGYPADLERVLDTAGDSPAGLSGEGPVSVGVQEASGEGLGDILLLPLVASVYITR
jgi:hypothetical protein